MSLGGDIGGLLGSMAGKAVDPLFWFYVPLGGVLLVRHQRMAYIALTASMATLNLLVVWPRWKRLGGGFDDAAFLLLIWIIWALIIFGGISAFQRLRRRP